MPATIPSHQAAVLPLKLWRPDSFDGVALVVASMAPDFPYVFAGAGIEVHSHALHSLIWYAIPVTALVSALVRWAAPAVAAHLPAGGPLALRDYGTLATVRHPFVVTAWSAVIGAFSHIAWDAVTHPYIVALDPLAPFPGLPWWLEIRLGSDLLGPVAVLLTALHIGRRRLLVAWHGPAPVVTARPAVFWGVAAAAMAALLAAAAAAPGNESGLYVVGPRIAAAVAGGLLAAAFVARIAPPARRA